MAATLSRNTYWLHRWSYHKTAQSLYLWLSPLVKFTFSSQTTIIGYFHYHYTCLQSLCWSICTKCVTRAMQVFCFLQIMFAYKERSCPCNRRLFSYTVIIIIIIIIRTCNFLYYASWPLRRKEKKFFLMERSRSKQVLHSNFKYDEDKSKFKGIFTYGSKTSFCLSYFVMQMSCMS